MNKKSVEQAKCQWINPLLKFVYFCTEMEAKSNQAQNNKDAIVLARVRKVFFLPKCTCYLLGNPIFSVIF